MLRKWLNIIIHLSNKIYNVKNKLFYSNIFLTFFYGLVLVFLEIILSLLSLPLYLFIKPSRTREVFESNEMKQDFIIISHYKLRRRLTIFSLAACLLLIFAKSIFIFFTTSFPTFAEIRDIKPANQKIVEPNYEDVNFSGKQEPIPKDNEILKDVKDHWGEAYIKYYWLKDIINTRETGEINPDDTITKVDYLKLVLLAFEIEVPAKVESMPYNDVDKDDWYAPFVYKAYNLKIFNKSENIPEKESFHPLDPVTRGEAIKILILASGIKMKDCDLNFTDLSENDEYSEFISIADEIDIISGYEDGTFRPQSTVSRAEASKIVYLMEKYLYE